MGRYTVDGAISQFICKLSVSSEFEGPRHRLAAFLRYAYKLEDIPFMELKREFVEAHVVLCIWDFNAFGEIRTIFSDVLFRSCRE